MAKLEIIEVTRKELDEGRILFNHVLVESDVTLDGMKTKGGVIVGFNEDTIWAEGENSWAADNVINHGTVYKLPEKLIYGEDERDSMEWKTEMELCENDVCWFSIIEAYNATTLLCEGRYLKLIPYQDIYCCKREIWVDKWSIPQKKKTVVYCLNGYVLCQTINRTKISDLDAISEDQIDTTKVIVRYVGNPNVEYKQESYVDFQDLRSGDEVLLQQRTSFVYLERKKWFSKFMGDELFVVIPRRKIVAVLNRKNG